MASHEEPLACAYSDAIATATEWVAAGTETERQRAREFVLHAFSLGAEMWALKADPNDPRFTVWEHPWRKFGGDNPWTIYSCALASPENTYEIRGLVGDPTYLGFQVYANQAGFNVPTANVSLDDLKLDGSGRLELSVGRTRPPGATNWLPLTDGDELVMVREYRHDPDTQRTSRLSLERIGSPRARSVPYDERVARAAKWSLDGVLGTMEITDLMRSSAFNAFPAADAEVRRPRYGNALYPTKDNVYEGLYVSLAADQALRLTGRLPAARYCSIVFYDVWFTTLDYPRTRCYLSDRELTLDSDGCYDIVVGPTNPGVPGSDWIDTGGLREGILAIRTLLATERVRPDVEIVDAAAKQPA